MERNQISAVIFDLDDTLLDSESVMESILNEFLGRYGKVADPAKEEKMKGKAQKESAAAYVAEYELPMTPDQFSDQIMPIYRRRWNQAKPLPGVNRLLSHLHSHGVPLALASNSVKKHIEMKISHQQGWKEIFSVVLGGDEVNHGKPAPDIFLEAAKRLGVDPSNCLVIEDSPVGVRAAKASGANVVAVPSLQNQDDQYSTADTVLRSLLEFQPELWSLPAFEDWVQNVLPIEPLHVRGVIGEGVYHDGYTSFNLVSDDSPFASLPDQVSGVFFGWARVQLQGTFKIVVAIGWDSSSGTAKKTTQFQAFGHIKNSQSKEQLVLVLIGYLRKISREVDATEGLRLCEEDMIRAQTALELVEFSQHKDGPFLVEAAFGDEA